MELDKRNGNTLWSDANTLEHEKLREYDVFIDKGQYHISKVPRGYRKISVHTIFDVKHDGRHRAWVVADGHLKLKYLLSLYIQELYHCEDYALVFLSGNLMAHLHTVLTSAALIYVQKLPRKFALKLVQSLVHRLADYLLLIKHSMVYDCLERHLIIY